MAAAAQDQAGDDAGTAVMYAVNLAMLQDRGGTPSLTPAECFEDYADSLLRDLGGSAERALAAARGRRRRVGTQDRVPDAVAQAALAVELCQRGAEMTGQVLPGSYRPGSREGSATPR